MEGLNSLPPEYLIAICEFTYASRGEKRYLPNEVRRFLVGTIQQTGEDRRPGLPERIAERFGSRLLVPLYFSLIKHPMKIGGLLANAALGAIAVYRVPVIDEDAFMQLCSAVNEEWQKRFCNVKEIKGFKIIAGYGVGVEC
jgi:hypothetical protein